MSFLSSLCDVFSLHYGRNDSLDGKIAKLEFILKSRSENIIINYPTSFSGRVSVEKDNEGKGNMREKQFSNTLKGYLITIIFGWRLSASWLF